MLKSLKPKKSVRTVGAQIALLVRMQEQGVTRDWFQMRRCGFTPAQIVEGYEVSGAIDFWASHVGASVAMVRGVDKRDWALRAAGLGGSCKAIFGRHAY